MAPAGVARLSLSMSGCGLLEEGLRGRSVERRAGSSSLGLPSCFRRLLESVWELRVLLLCSSSSWIVSLAPPSLSRFEFLDARCDKRLPPEPVFRSDESL